MRETENVWGTGVGAKRCKMGWDGCVVADSESQFSLCLISSRLLCAPGRVAASKKGVQVQGLAVIYTCYETRSAQSGTVLSSRNAMVSR